MPTLRQLEYLVALADAGHFGVAARRCAVSQPALSKQVREVEELWGVPLFERSSRGVRATPAGEAVVARARALLVAARDLAETAVGFAGRAAQRVRLGVIPTVAPYGLAGLLTKLRARFPGTTFVLSELPTAALLTSLREGRLDLALLARPFETQGIEGPDLVREPFVLVAPEGHALDAPGAVEVSELIGAELILMQEGHCLRDQALEICARAIAPASAEITAASLATLTRMVESALGATLLPASALSAEVRAGQGLVARAFGGRAPGRTLTLQWRCSAPHGAWYEEIGLVIQAHYLQLNATLPKVEGGLPVMEAVVREGASAGGTRVGLGGDGSVTGTSLREEP